MLSYCRYEQNGKNEKKGKRKKLMRLHTVELLLSSWKIVDMLIKDSSRDDARRSTFDLDIESTHGKPATCRARPMNVNDGLEDIRWIRALGGERLPAASYALSLNLKKTVMFCHRRGIDTFWRLFCFLHTSGHRLLYQTPGRRPPRITGRVVNTVTRGRSP